MLDDIDEGARIGVWTVLGILALLLFGIIGGLAIRSMQGGAVPARPAAAAAAPAADELIDAPLAGDVVGKLYFALGQAALPADAPAAVDAIKAAAAGSASRRLVISGFHDATGDPAKNAELAKERAKNVREALKAAGVDAARIALRKPESTTGDGNDQEARRVEVRLLP